VEVDMICPACGTTMVEEDFGGVIIDYCKYGCHSMWFDWMEIVRLDESGEGFGDALKATMDDPRSNDDDRDPINCPKCDVPMHVHRYKSARDVNIDECYMCGGFFLDSGELRGIRDEHITEAEEKAYVDSLLQNIPSYQEGLKGIEKDRQRAAAVKKMTRFLRPSFYITGR